MITAAQHDAAVRSAFDLQEARFKTAVDRNDVRLQAVLRALGPLRGRRVLDLGCGKGRFATLLSKQGADIIGLDLSHVMLSYAEGIARVQASARMLPIAAESVDHAIGIEVFEHLDEAGMRSALNELERVLRPGGRLAIIDKNAAALNSRRPWVPNLAVKWIDQKRGLWMYPDRGPVRERWFLPRRFARQLRQHFGDVRTEYLLSPDEAGSRVFERWPALRRMVLWTARREGGRDG
jgi:ubiquinone/menaquinone biosynthesis C-methylase UbiE